MKHENSALRKGRKNFEFRYLILPLAALSLEAVLFFFFVPAPTRATHTSLAQLGRFEGEI